MPIELSNMLVNTGEEANSLQHQHASQLAAAPKGSRVVVRLLLWMSNASVPVAVADAGFIISHGLQQHCSRACAAVDIHAGQRSASPNDPLASAKHYSLRVFQNDAAWQPMCLAGLSAMC
jgi:hypothetical protein